METRTVEVTFWEKDKFAIAAQASGVNFYSDKKSENYVPAGPDPLELFLSSLASCVGVYAKRYLTTHAKDFKELKIKAGAEFTSSSPARLVNIKVETFCDAKLSREENEVFLRFIQNCPSIIPLLIPTILKLY